MNRQALLDEIRNSRSRLVEVLREIPEAFLAETGVAGDWSVKDIIHHVSRMEAELIALLYQAQQARVPPSSQLAQLHSDALNAKWFQEGRNRSSERVWADFEGVHHQLLKRIDVLAGQDLTDPKRYPWLRGQTLQSFIAKNSAEHEAEHAAQIQSWWETKTGKG